MSEGFPQAYDVDKAIFVDEVGLEIGIYGHYRLKTSYQPIFMREGSNLVPVALEARVAPHRHGEQTSATEFFDEVPPSDRQFVEAVCRALHLRNHRNLGADDVAHLQLYLTVDPRLEMQERSTSSLASIARMADKAGLSPEMIICEILDAPALQTKALAAIAKELRGYGVRISIAEFRVGKSAIDRVTRIEPDVIKIDGTWFRNMQDSAETARLFPAVITAFRGLGAKLLVQGIETSAELEAALESRADYLQGMLLASPALVGTILDDRPRPIRALIQHDRKIVPLGGKHQKG
jgi:EAL domain-containing protein (putative c-di-GMP-specific phosphodiesterase class I)